MNSSTFFSKQHLIRRRIILLYLHEKPPPANVLYDGLQGVSFRWIVSGIKLLMQLFPRVVVMSDVVFPLPISLIFSPIFIIYLNSFSFYWLCYQTQIYKNRNMGTLITSQYSINQIRLQWWNFVKDLNQWERKQDVCESIQTLQWASLIDKQTFQSIKHHVLGEI